MTGAVDYPEDIIRRMLSFVSAKDAVTFKTTCKKFNREVNQLIDRHLAPFQDHINSFEETERGLAKMQLFVALDGPLLVAFAGPSISFINMSNNVML